VIRLHAVMSFAVSRRTRDGCRKRFAERISENLVSVDEVGFHVRSPLGAEGAAQTLG
jgi:hypothetical protein